jgi:Zn-dependent M28 family amino/carboxypeptidase
MKPSAVWLLVAAILSLLLGWGSMVYQPQAATPVTLSVDQERLQTHLDQLAFERYQPVDRETARAYLIRTLSLEGYAVFGQGYSSGQNLIAERPGTDPAAGTILVGAHYDTVLGCPGADDNASAVAVVLELARLFAQHPTPRTLKLVLFDQEEIQPAGTGLLGSTAFVADRENLADLKGAVILEMLGFACDTPGCQTYPPGLPLSALPDRGNFLAVIGDRGHLELLQAFQSANGPNLPILTLPIAVDTLAQSPDLFRSDHTPFWLQGIGAVMVTDTANFRNPHYHRSTDTPDSLNSAFLVRVAQAVAESVERLLVP